MEEKLSVKATQALGEISTLVEQSVDNRKLHQVYLRLQRKLKSEIKFLETKSRNKVSSNIPYLLGVFAEVQKSNNVEQIICDYRKYGIIIDVICDGGRTWKKVIARNPQTLHLVWAGKGEYGSKDIVTKIQKYINAAKKESEFSPPSVEACFINGVTQPMAEHLEKLGVKVIGQREPVSELTSRRLQTTEELTESDAKTSEFDSESDEGELITQTAEQPLTGRSAEIALMPTDEKVFLDVTSMVIFVSDVCNGGEMFEFEDQEMKTQAEQERATPVMDVMRLYFGNRLLVTCETALKNFKSFMEVLGGEREKERAQELISKLTVVPDNVSEKFQQIIKRGKIKERSKVIFGTADRLRCNIMTSNDGFIRAAAAQGVSVSAITHQSRALSELRRIEETEKKSEQVR